MFKLGDIVTPVTDKIGHGYNFRINIIEKDDFGTALYKLERVTDKLNPMYGPIDKQLETLKKVEDFTWFEKELTNDVYSYRPCIVDNSSQSYKTTPVISNVTISDSSITSNISSTTGTSTVRMTADCINIIPDKRKKGEDNMKILDIYGERKEQEIINNYHKEKEKIIQEDEIQKIVSEMVKQINVILENEDRNEKVNIEEPVSSLLTTETNKKIADLELKTDSARDELRSTLEEIRALFELTEDYQERIKILKKYNIINKDGKLNV